MAIEFHGVAFPPLKNLTVSAPGGAVIGVAGENGAGKSALLRLAAGVETAEQGEVIRAGSGRYLGPCDPLDLSPVDLLALDHCLARQDGLGRAEALVGIGRLRNDGATVLIASHEADLLRRFSDEIWWLEAGELRRRGDPGEVLEAYQQRIAEKFRNWAATAAAPLRWSQRRGDGRAQIVSLETLSVSGQPSMVLRSGEEATVRVRLRYQHAVEDPVVGILIRTRVGLEVYGTNTELERIKLGPCAEGSELQLAFRFVCDLCPGEYTLTAASHDPDGAAHDWIDDAVAFQVTDSRYTAGVANLKAKVEVEKI